MSFLSSLRILFSLSSCWMCLDCSTISLALATCSAKSEKTKVHSEYSENEGIKPRRNAQKRKQTLVFDDMFLQDGSFTLFGFNICASFGTCRWPCPSEHSR